MNVLLKVSGKRQKLTAGAVPSGYLPAQRAEENARRLLAGAFPDGRYA